MNAGGRRPPGLARSILSNWGAFAFTAVVSFVLSPFIVRSLGDSRYGVWVLLTSLVGNLGLLDLGVRSAVSRYIARYHAGGEHETASRLYTAGLRIFGLAGTLSLAISAGMALLIGTLFKVPPEYVLIGRIVAVLGGLNMAVTLVGGLFGGVLIGLERFDLANGLEVLVGLLRAVAIVVVLKAGYGLIALSLVQLGATLLRGGVSVVLVRRLYAELRLVAGPWDWTMVRLILSYGIAAAMLNAAATLMVSSSSLVLGALLPASMITFWGIAANLNEYARSVVSGISYTVTPRISALQARGDLAPMQGAVTTSARLTAFVVLPIATTFLLRGASFIGLWMGPQYAALSGRVLQILALTLWPIAGYQVAAAAILGVAKQRRLIPIFFAEAGLNIALSVVLVRSMGVVGAAIGTLIPRLIMSVVVGPWFVRRELGLPLRTFWVVAFLRPTVAILPFAAATWAVERYWPAAHLATYFAQVALALPVAAVGFWFLCLDAAERASLGERMQTLARKASLLR